MPVAHSKTGTLPLAFEVERAESTVCVKVFRHCPLLCVLSVCLRGRRKMEEYCTYKMVWKTADGRKESWFELNVH